MHRSSSSRRRRGPAGPAPRRLVSVLATVGALAAGAAILVAAPPAPAGAGSVTTTFTTTSPVTWVDGEGRQLMLATVTGSQLTITRDTPAGDPDTSWGPGGVRTVQPSVPAGAASTSSRIAADDTGRLTIVFQTAGCSGALPCDRWFQQVDATGATVSGPTLAEDVPPTWRTLEDGSLLLGAPGTPVAWHGPDGSERKLLPLLTDDVVHADVDQAHRLLVLTRDGTAHRYSQDGLTDLTVDTACDAVDSNEGPGAIGASKHAVGFAVACTAGGGAKPTVYGYDDEGGVSWSAPGSAAGAPSGRVTDVTVTGNGHAWVATRLDSLFPFLPDGRGLVAVTAASWDGWEAAAYQRVTGGTDHRDMGGGVVSMRGTAASKPEVALADLKVCCQYASNATGGMAAYSAIVPYRPGPPLTKPGFPLFRLSPDRTLTVQFSGAPAVAGRSNRDPDHYRVDAVIDGTEATATAPFAGPGAAAHVEFDQPVPGGTLVTAEVAAVNSYGDGVKGAGRGATITPFVSVYDFVDQQTTDLRGRPLSTADRDSYVESLTEGGHSPAGFMEEILEESPQRDAVEPAARIYRAAFLRDPDIGGLRYWFERRREGVRLAAIAEQFVRSSEFQRRYGTLGNRTFVERIYQNVLGRLGDRAGIDFWTKRLDARKATRGAVLAGFSESSEFVRKTNGIVQPLTVTFLMLDRRPTAAEKATWSTSEAVYADMPAAILDTEEYLELIDARPFG